MHRDLKEFYDTQIKAKSSNMPAYEDANAELLETVEKSITFSLWKFNRAWKALKNKFK